MLTSSSAPPQELFNLCNLYSAKPPTKLPAAQVQQGAMLAAEQQPPAAASEPQQTELQPTTAAAGGSMLEQQAAPQAADSVIGYAVSRPRPVPAIAIAKTVTAVKTSGTFGPAARAPLSARGGRPLPLAGGAASPSTKAATDHSPRALKPSVPRVPLSARAAPSQKPTSAGGSSRTDSAPTPRRSMSARPSSSASGRRIGVDPLLGHGYETLSPIAQGAFSQVARARHLSTQREVAVKTFHKAKYFQPNNSHLCASAPPHILPWLVVLVLRASSHRAVVDPTPPVARACRTGLPR